MAYTPTEWKNREVERPRTVRLQDNPDGTKTLISAEGNVIEAGTPIIADVMNNIEQGIKEAHDELAGIGDVQQELTTHLADYVKHPGYGVTTGTNNAYAINLNPAPTAYVDGMGIVIKLHVASGLTPTINVNGLGAKGLVKKNDDWANNLRATVYSFRYSASAGAFILQDEGGEYGTAEAPQVLSGYTLGRETGIVSGTMPNRGAFNLGLGVNVPEGYYSGGTTANGVRYAAGTVVAAANGLVTISGIPFRPKNIEFWRPGFNQMAYWNSIWQVSTVTQVSGSQAFSVPFSNFGTTINDDGFTNFQAGLAGVTYNYEVFG